MKTVTEQYWIVTGEWPDGRSPSACRITAPNTVDDADELAEKMLAAGAIRVSVEPFRRMIPRDRRYIECPDCEGSPARWPCDSCKRDAGAIRDESWLDTTLDVM